MLVFTFFLLTPMGAMSMFFYTWFLEYFNMLFSNMMFFNLTMLSIIFISLMWFSIFYMKGYKNIIFYWVMMFLFMMSMFFLILSSSYFLFLMSWDMLGLTSFLLINYYNSWESINGSVLTMMTNRVGDVFLFWFITYLFFKDMLNLNFISSFFIMFLLITSMTKSAMFPFISWLPKAMSAPTPTSGLVHSSTLVTAGLFLVMKFYLNINNIMSFYIFFLGVITTIVSGIMSLIETDMKKLIALSTLNQLGFMYLSISFNNIFLTMIHLMSHGFIKSCLFANVGYIMMNAKGLQESKMYSKFSTLNSLNFIMIFVNLLSLCGLNYLSGFYSKEMLLILSFYSTFKLNMMMYLLIVLFSFIYSSRIIIFLMNESFMKMNFFLNMFSILPLIGLFSLSMTFTSFFYNSFWVFYSVSLYNDVKIILMLFLLYMMKINMTYYMNMGFMDNLYQLFSKISFLKHMSFFEWMIYYFNNKLFYFMNMMFMNNMNMNQFIFILLIMFLMFFV